MVGADAVTPEDVVEAVVLLVDDDDVSNTPVTVFRRCERGECQQQGDRSHDHDHPPPAQHLDRSQMRAGWSHEPARETTP